MEVLPDIFSEYEPCDIFNTDETELYQLPFPDVTLAVKHSKAVGCKVPKEQLTLLLRWNMDGSEPLVNGKSQNSRT